MTQYTPLTLAFKCHRLDREKTQHIIFSNFKELSHRHHSQFAFHHGTMPSISRALDWQFWAHLISSPFKRYVEFGWSFTFFVVCCRGLTLRSHNALGSTAAPCLLEKHQVFFSVCVVCLVVTQLHFDRLYLITSQNKVPKVILYKSTSLWRDYCQSACTKGPDKGDHLKSNMAGVNFMLLSPKLPD